MTPPRGKHLNAALARALDNRKSQSTIRSLTIQPPNSVDFSSNDFLSLATSQELRDLYLEELRTGPSTAHLGSGGSRLLDGNSTYAEQLEDDIAAFHRAEKGLLCNSGFDANVGLFSCLPQPRDVIVYDEFIHASVHDGMRLSRAGRKIAFAHNSADALKLVVEQLMDSDEAIVSGHRNVFIAVEAVYSMDGDIPDVHEMIRIKKKYKALLFLDEAHSFGTMGATGRGICEHLNVDPKDVDVRMGTMSKALGSVGGFILGSQTLIKYLKHCAGGFVFSVGLAPACGSAALRSIRLMTETPSRTITLQERSKKFYDLCKMYMIPMGENTFRGAPVVVVMIGSTIATAKASEFLAMHGVNVKPIVYPAVEEGKCRLRFFISALHTPKQLEDTVLTLKTYLCKGIKDARKAAMVAANDTSTDRVAKASENDGIQKAKKRAAKKK